MTDSMQCSIQWAYAVSHKLASTARPDAESGHVCLYKLVYTCVNHLMVAIMCRHDRLTSVSMDGVLCCCLEQIRCCKRILSVFWHCLWVVHTDSQAYQVYV